MMGGKALALLFALSASSLVLASDDAYPKYFHSVKKLHKTNCPKSERVRRGDEVTITLSASVTTAMGDTYKSEGAAEKQFIVGRHEIIPLNQGVVGMCAGDVRRVRIRVEQSPGAKSDPMDYIVTMVSRDHVSRVKAYVEDPRPSGKAVASEAADVVEKKDGENTKKEEDKKTEEEKEKEKEDKEEESSDNNNNKKMKEEEEESSDDHNKKMKEEREETAIRVDGKGDVLEV